MNRVTARIPHRVHDSPRHEDETARLHRQFPVTEQERRFPTGKIERLIRGRVGMRGRPRFTRREHANESHVCPLGLGWAESSGVRLLGRADNGATVHCLLAYDTFLAHSTRERSASCSASLLWPQRGTQWPDDQRSHRAADSARSDHGRSVRRSLRVPLRHATARPECGEVTHARHGTSWRQVCSWLQAAESTGPTGGPRAAEGSPGIPQSRV